MGSSHRPGLYYRLTERRSATRKRKSVPRNVMTFDTSPF